MSRNRKDETSVVLPVHSLVRMFHRHVEEALGGTAEVLLLDSHARGEVGPEFDVDLPGMVPTLYPQTDAIVGNIAGEVGFQGGWYCR